MIETVKIQGDGYLVNGTMSVPKADGNKDYEAVKKWIADGGIVGSEFNSEELFIQAVDQKSIDIGKDFDTSELVPVEHLGNIFIGGSESADSIDKYVRLMKLGGITEFMVWDMNGDEHPFDSDGVDALLFAIGSVSAMNKFEKKNRRVALAKAKTIIEVDAV